MSAGELRMEEASSEAHFSICSDRLWGPHQSFMGFRSWWIDLGRAAHVLLVDGGACATASR